MAPWERTHLPSRRSGFEPWVGKIPWRRKRQPTPVFLPGKSPGQKGLVGYGPWDCKGVGHDLETKQHHISHSLKQMSFSLYINILLVLFLWSTLTHTDFSSKKWDAVLTEVW